MITFGVRGALETGGVPGIARQCRFFNMMSAITPHPIPSLPTLVAMDCIVRQQPLLANVLRNKQLIGAQHNLETTASIYRSFIDTFHCLPEDMHMMGKCYSSNPAVKATIEQLGVQLYADPIPERPEHYSRDYGKVIKTMWEALIKDWSFRRPDAVIGLDDGGRVIEGLPIEAKFEGIPMALIEQTRGGLYSQAIEFSLCPLVSVASSAAKKCVEPPLIATAVLSEIDELLLQLAAENKLTEKSMFGVIGNGAIGMAIIHHLLQRGYRVVIYDDDPDTKTHFKGLTSENIFRVRTKREFFTNVHCVFGCTGQDVSKGVNLLNIIQPGRELVLASCSSENKEFFTVLKQIHTRLRRGARKPSSSLDTLTYTNPAGGTIHVLRHGYPINFNRKPWNVPARDIEMTQGLLVSAVLQASMIARPMQRGGVQVNASTIHCLDPYLQRFVVRCWASRPENRQRYEDGFFDKFENIDWIIENSGGDYHPNQILKQAFEAPPLLEATSQSDESLVVSHYSTRSMS